MANEITPTTKTITIVNAIETVTCAKCPNPQPVEKARPELWLVNDGSGEQKYLAQNQRAPQGWSQVGDKWLCPSCLAALLP